MKKISVLSPILRAIPVFILFVIGYFWGVDAIRQSIRLHLTALDVIALVSLGALAISITTSLTLVWMFKRLYNRLNEKIVLEREVYGYHQD